jgi:hypothetical protein
VCVGVRALMERDWPREESESAVEKEELAGGDGRGWVFAGAGETGELAAREKGGKRSGKRKLGGRGRKSMGGAGQLGATRGGGAPPPPPPPPPTPPAPPGQLGATRHPPPPPFLTLHGDTRHHLVTYGNVPR